MNVGTRILVTGASGFTGRYARAALEKRGYSVIGTNLNPASNDLECDLTSIEQVRRVVREAVPEKVLHLGGISFVGEKDVKPFYDVNVLGSENLLAALSEMDRPPSRVVLASSANVYGATKSGRLTEDLCPRPINHYAISKLAMERIAEMYRGRLSITVSRPFNYTGVGQDERFLIPKIVSHFRRRESTIRLGNLDVWRDFSDVRDIVRIYIRLLEAENPPAIVNLCSGTVHDLRTILQLLSSISGHEIEVQQDESLIRANEIEVLRGDERLLESLTEGMPRRQLAETLEWMYAV